MACPVCGNELTGIERTGGVCSACGKETLLFHGCVSGHVLCPSCAEASVRQAIREDRFREFKEAYLRRFYAGKQG